VRSDIGYIFVVRWVPDEGEQTQNSRDMEEVILTKRSVLVGRIYSFPSIRSEFHSLNLNPVSETPNYISPSPGETSTNSEIALAQLAVCLKRYLQHERHTPYRNGRRVPKSVALHAYDGGDHLGYNPNSAIWFQWQFFKHMSRLSGSPNYDSYEQPCYYLWQP
jgi:hypothetical protein